MQSTSPSVKFIVQHRRTICGFLIILLLFELLIVYFIVQNYKENYISRSDAVTAVMEAAGLTTEQVSDLDSDFETDDGRAWFEVSFNYDGSAYIYKVSAEKGSGEVTLLKKEP